MKKLENLINEQLMISGQLEKVQSEEHNQQMKCKMDTELVLEEIEERNISASNLMIYNVEESRCAETAHKIDYDTIKSKDIFTFLEIQVYDEDVKESIEQILKQ